MKIPVTCMECFKEQGRPDEKLYSLEVRDDGLYEVTCRNNHRSVIFLQEQKFEVLSELAAHAIVDGYYREAVASFATSMERFFEFYLRTCNRARNVSPDSLEAAWKAMSRQSERQLGAFIASYLAEEGSSPTLLPTSKIELRNDVIHRGKIPSREEATKFGENVLAVVRPALNALKAKHRDTIAAYALVRGLTASVDATKKNIPLASMTIPTLISITREHPGPETVQDAITRILGFRQRFEKQLA